MSIVGFEAFVADAKGLFGNENNSTVVDGWDVKFDITERKEVGRVYLSVVNMLTNAGLGRGNAEFTSKLGDNVRIANGYENFSSVSALSSDLKSLIDTNNIPDHAKFAVLTGLGNIINRYGREDLLSIHWAGKGNDQADTVDTMFGTGQMMSSSEFSYSTPVGFGQETFGVNMDMTMPDVRAAMTIVLLNPLRGITDRIFHKKTVVSPVVRYVIVNSELYDLAKSKDSKGSVRDSFSHRVPMLTLYRNPDELNYDPIRVQPKNATDPVLVPEDNYLAFNKPINMFDMAKDVNDIRTTIDGSSFLGDSIRVLKVVFTVTDTVANKTETFEVPVEDVPQCRLNLLEQANHAADRGTIMNIDFPMNKDTPQRDGSASTLLATVTDPSLLYAKLQVSVTCNRTTSLTHAQLSGYVEPSYPGDNAVTPQPIKDLAKKLVVEGVMFEIHAVYSEENARMSNLVVRSGTATRSYEIPVSRNFAHDYSMAEVEPDDVMDVIHQLQSIGVDRRNCNLTQEYLEMVNVAQKKQAMDPFHRASTDNRTLNNMAAAGTRVNPRVVIKNIDISRVQSIRSGDMMGDIKQYLDSYLLKLFSVLHMESLFLNQVSIKDITYKTITSPLILDNLLSVPHYHDHMNSKENVYNQVRDSKEEYQRVLPSGIKLDVSTTTFKSFDHKMLMIPYIDGGNDNIFNFATNYEYGTFAAHYMPQFSEGIFKRLLVNQREYIIPTNLIGLVITFKDPTGILPDINI